MSFIQQQFNSFLNLGGCKEYLIMARTKIPGSKTKKDTIVPNGAADNVTQTPPTLEALQGGATKAETKKRESARTDSRATVLPINLEEEIRRRAYEIYQRRGLDHGSETDDWLIAEQEVMQRYSHQSA
jgi:predicted nucleic acid-binding protein